MRRASSVEGARVAWHRRLTVRVFGVTALIAVVATAAATFATVQTTSVAVEQQQQDSLHADAAVYSALTGFAATHSSWADAGPLLRRLDDGSGRRLVLVGQDGRSVLTPGRGARSDPARATAVIDPLDLDPELPRSNVSSAPSPVAQVPTALPVDACPGACALTTVAPSRLVDPRLTRLTGSRAARTVAAIRRATDTCLRAAGTRPVALVTRRLEAVVARGAAERAAGRCLDLAIEDVLRPSVAPRAYLVDRSAATAGVVFDLSPANRMRIALLAAGVLLVALAAAALLSAGLTRPLRRMAVAARRAAEGDLGARMPERRDEVGRVAAAFNTMADERQRLERSRERLMSDVSHDLRSPLSNVRGWIEAAQDGVVAADGRLLRTLHDEALHLQGLIDDLQELATGDAGERRLRHEAVPVAGLLHEVAEAFRPAAIRGGIALRVEGPESVAVDGDRARLKQVVVNLVSNAVRHTAQGGAVVLRATEAGFEVDDDGEGIPVDQTEAVFERFHRVDASRTRATGGTGLGLAIVRQLVEEHGGRVAIASALGEGTVVTVELPLHRTVRPERQALAPPVRR